MNKNLQLEIFEYLNNREIRLNNTLDFEESISKTEDEFISLLGEFQSEKNLEKTDTISSTDKEIYNKDFEDFLKSKWEEAIKKIYYDKETTNCKVLIYRYLGASTKIDIKHNSFYQKNNIYLPDNSENLINAINNITKKKREYYFKKWEVSKIFTKKLENYLGEKDTENVLYKLNFGKRIIIHGKRISNEVSVCSVNGLESSFTKYSDCYAKEGAFISIFNFNKQSISKISIYIPTRERLFHSNPIRFENVKYETSLCEKKVIEKQKIKMARIIDNSIIQIFTHGFSEPEFIIFDDYEEANKFYNKIIKRETTT